MPRFAVLRSRGPAWDESRPLRSQDAWDDHARFMDALVSDGFIVLGGPLGRAQRTLLIVDAPDAQSVRDTLAADPWVPMGLLDLDSVDEWHILLDPAQADATAP